MSVFERAYNALNLAGCDIETQERVRKEKNLPGAIWHFYKYSDVPKIREFLKKQAIKRAEKCGKKIKENSADPIHAQTWYLDGKLRDSLKREYEVEGFCIVQCEGDAVIIPAGAPHQVKN